MYPQGDLIDEQKKCDEEEEHLFYDKVVIVCVLCVCVRVCVTSCLSFMHAQIHQSHQSEEKAEKDFIDFVQRTSNYKLLQEAKQRQISALDMSGRSNVAIG